MKAFFALIFFLSLTFTSTYVSGQVNDQSIRKEVLQKAVIDSNFIFGKWTEKGGTETHLKYLGRFTTKHGHTFKILNSMWFWGLSHRATSRILVFNKDDDYVGNYYVTVTSDLPTKMENGKLIFKNFDADCDNKLNTIIDLKRGLPQQFFRKCKEKEGDIYIFEKE
jgi:hypothetical protein